MVILTIISIMFFMLGGTIGVFIGLFIASVGRINSEHDFYQEGFIDGYNNAKEKMRLEEKY